MGEPKKVGKIEVEEDLQFLKREWMFQRIGWIAMALVLVAGSLGALGRGALSHATAGDRHVFGAEYSRILRHGASDKVRIFVGPGLQSDSAVHIAVSTAYLAEFQIENVKPEPASQRHAGAFIVFDFLRADPRTPLDVSIQLRPAGYGSVIGRIQLLGSNTLELRSFILP